MTTMIDRAEGCLVGAITGDALGMPAEYISREEHQQFYNGKITSFQNPLSRHPCAHLHKGQYTDDGQRLIILAESLLAHDGLDLHDLGKRIGEWAYKCQTIPGYDRFSGGTSMFAGLALYGGKDPHFSGKNTPTCGSAMAIAPIGIFYHQSSSDEISIRAAQVSRVTHTHPMAVDGAIFISQLIAGFMNNLHLEKTVERARKALTSDLKEKIDYVIESRKREPREIAKHIGASEKVNETVPMAVHCFLHSPTDFEKTVIEAANLVPGDTDSIACIAGALSGAYNGYAAIPSKFKEGLEDEEKVRILGQRLAEASIASS